MDLFALENALDLTTPDTEYSAARWLEAGPDDLATCGLHNAPCFCLLAGPDLEASLDELLEPSGSCDLDAWEQESNASLSSDFSSPSVLLQNLGCLNLSNLLALEHPPTSASAPGKSHSAPKALAQAAPRCLAQPTHIPALRTAIPISNEWLLPHATFTPTRHSASPVARTARRRTSSSSKAIQAFSPLRSELAGSASRPRSLSSLAQPSESANAHSRLVICDSCNQRNVQRQDPSSFAWHRELQFDGTESLAEGTLCQVCGGGLDAQLMPRVRGYMCHICQHSYRSSDRLVAHAAKHNNGLKAFCCGDCGRTFSRQSRLFEHQDRYRHCKAP
eukprot:m.796013 g.796013  ORF g.796013 m.796013 type:complete len:333 (-) comp59245_c0_seq31:1879-2877(-)